MAAPVFPGQVSVQLYFGTPFDYVNVPYNTQLILDAATRTITVQASCVRQTTWLSTWRLNIDDYQHIVGCQFALIIDTGVEDHGAHWYYVTSYRMLNKNCCEMTLQYDPLLSIGINRIYGITGIMRRWTVGDDEEWNWTHTQEPINQAMPFHYSYSRIKPVQQSSTSFLKVVGFPVNMGNPVTIISVWDSELQQFQLPNFGPATPTDFVVHGLSLVPFNDGYTYYNWTTLPNHNVWENYNAAVAFGMNLPTQAYILPPSSLIQTTAASDPAAFFQIIGDESDFSSGFQLVAPGSYNNRKTAEIGRNFTLYNEFTGDAVTVANWELDSSNIHIYCNPYANGGFLARFSDYLFDTDGFAGLVSSPGWQPMTLTSVSGVGQDLANFNMRFASQLNSINMERSEWNRRIATARENANYWNDYLRNIMGTIAGERQNNDLLNWGSAAARYGGSVSTAGFMMQAAQEVVGMGSRAVQGLTNSQMHDWNLQDISRQYSLETAQQQAFNNFLNGRGNIADAQPPQTKFAQTNIFTTNSYDFVVRMQDLTTDDRIRADLFFTQYGYNVDGLTLAESSFLNCRDRFTFIQADDVRITSVNNGTPMTRLNDMQTVNFVEERFAGGIRIWNTIPSFDFSIPNRAKENPYTGNNSPDAPDVIIPETPPSPIEPGPNPTPRQIVLNYAMSQNGVTEKPRGSNNVIYNTAFYGREFPKGGPSWCVVFIWYCFMMNGLSHLFCGGNKVASCTKVLEYYPKDPQQVHYSQTRPGDLVIWSWLNSKKKLQRHIGMITEVSSTSTKYITIEGNAGKDSSEVCFCDRFYPDRSNIFINPYGD